MVRAGFYLVASAAVWFAEGFIFSRFLQLSAWQTALLAALYVLLFAIALVLLVRFARIHRAPEVDLATWRVLSVAPMVVAILGSFVSLPVLLLVVLAGKIF